MAKKLTLKAMLAELEAWGAYLNTERSPRGWNMFRVSFEGESLSYSGVRGDAIRTAHEEMQKSIQEQTAPELVEIVATPNEVIDTAAQFPAPSRFVNLSTEEEKSRRESLAKFKRLPLAYMAVRYAIQNDNLSKEAMQAKIDAFRAEYAEYADTIRRVGYLQDYLQDELVRRGKPEGAIIWKFGQDSFFEESEGVQKPVASDESFVSQTNTYTHAKTGNVYKVTCSAWESEGRVYNVVHLNGKEVSANDYPMTQNHVTAWMQSSMTGLRIGLETGRSKMLDLAKILPF